MSLKFSLRDLLLLIAAISVACAAMANAGPTWHSIVVTATLTSLTGVTIWAALHPGPRRAFAGGWLLFAAGYLVLVFGPWTGESLGPGLITSKGLALLELKALGENPSPPVASNLTQVMDLGSDLDLIATGAYTLSINGAPNARWNINQPWNGGSLAGITTFQSTGHWLLASVFGYCGAHLAAFLFHFRRNPDC